MATGFKIGRFRLTTSMMVWLILGITSIGGIVISTFHLTNFVYYMADALNLILACFAVRKLHILKRIKEIKVLSILLWIFIIDCVVGIIGNEVPIILALWGIRNVFRYIIFFTSCVVLLRKSDIFAFQKILPKLFIVNAVLAAFQHFILGYRTDYIGGLFGTSQGCNGALTIFLNIALAYFMAGYLSGTEKFYKLVLNSLIYFFVVILSETKGNFVFFVAIVGISLLVSKKSLKIFGIICMTAVSLVIGLFFLSKYVPESLDVLLNISAANEYMNASYLGTVTFTRNAALSVANKFFFKDNLWLYLFGYGIGACDTSSFFSSPFYERYGYMNYRLLSSSMTLLQNGYIGLFAYFSFMAYLFIMAFLKIGHTRNKNMERIMIMTCCIAVFAIGDSFYATLYIDAAYWLFFAFSIPFVLMKEE